jgi:uncharacterized coiled-coil protein SlyX
LELKLSQQSEDIQDMNEAFSLQVESFEEKISALEANLEEKLEESVSQAQRPRSRRIPLAANSRQTYEDPKFQKISELEQRMNSLIGNTGGSIGSQDLASLWEIQQDISDAKRGY